MARWFDLEGRAVFMDPETKQVLGQVVQRDIQFWAYDNDPAKHDGNGALLLGKFPFLSRAKEAVEKALQ